MCKVIFNIDKWNIDFLVYNLIFNKGSCSFTLESLWNKIREYDANVPKQLVQIKIDSMLDEGLVRQRIDGYCTTI